MDKLLEYSISTNGRSETPLSADWSTKHYNIIIVLKKHNKSPPLLWILNVFISTTFLSLSLHQTARLINGLTQTVPRQSLDRAFFCVGLNSATYL